MSAASAGARLRAALAQERPLQVVGTINAYSALLAQRSGFRAIYLSGAGVANASFGLPDLGITSAQRRLRGRAADRECHDRCRCSWTRTPAGARPSTSRGRSVT